MSAIANANLSLSSLFVAVNTAASSIDATFRTIGSVAQVMSDKSQSWAKVTREEIITSEEDRIDEARAGAALSIARRSVERNKQLAADPDLKAAYALVLARFDERRKAATA